MKLNMDTISKIIGNNSRFINPHDESGSYVILDDAYSANNDFDVEIINRYYEKLKYAVAHVDELIKNVFNDNFYDVYFVNKEIVKSPAQMCSGLIFDSFVMYPDHQTIGACLSNKLFMFGHFVDVTWDCDWNIINVWID